jgi:oxygen-independent coproporphyrinogen-3 oxidase
MDPIPETQNSQPATRNPQPKSRNPQLESRTPPKAGLYIHIPFCIQKCPYCDFYSTTDHSLIATYLIALSKEMQIASRNNLQFDAIYIGGGTPSLLTSRQLSEMLSNITGLFSIMPDAEITIEVNPGAIDRKKFSSYAEAGINRVNIGVQSFTPAVLQFLGRIHSVEDSRRAIQDARDAGFQNIGLDLIYGIPDQYVSAWVSDLKKVLAFNPEHLACYMLTFERGTPLEKGRRNGLFKGLDEKEIADQFRTTRHLLQDSGYEQYEISNFARIPLIDARAEITSGYRSRHNQKYWSFAPYIGLGPSAHSFIEPLRYWNFKDIKTYLRSLETGEKPIENKERLTLEQQLIEFIYLSLRTKGGIDIPRFKSKFQTDFHLLFDKILEELDSEDLITLTDNRCALKPKGMLLHESVAETLINRVDMERLGRDLQLEPCMKFDEKKRVPSV